MTMKAIFKVSVFAALFIGNLADWSYSNLDEWPVLCQTGDRQSPIALSNKIANKTSIPPLKFENYRSTRIATLVNNGHTVQVQIDDEENDRPTLSGGNLEEKYALDNIHFHWDSEHTINDKRYPLEAHLVHYKLEYGNVTTASAYLDGIVVLGVMFKEARFDYKKLNPIIDATRIAASKIYVPIDIKDLQIDEILSKNRRSFFTYEGSLTTPGCNEVVTWIVFDSPLYIGRAQLDELSKVKTRTEEPLTKNFRPLQELNCREIYHT